MPGTLNPPLGNASNLLPVTKKLGKLGDCPQASPILIWYRKNYTSVDSVYAKRGGFVDFMYVFDLNYNDTTAEEV
jgi:hypothetical protein